ncbi:hypothetical protein ACQEVY_16265 [Streptomyces sp. CA-288835]|uniref:hypothetical protein n=1 Tax=Streptomyces sp. CA-288835 TaxID=3240069 RepID=UPI003D8CF4BB
MNVTEQRGKGEGPARKVRVRVSMPAGLVAAVKARVGARGFSAYVSAAVERQIQRDLLEELLQKKEAEIGSPAAEVQEEAVEAFGEAEPMAAKERAAQGYEGSAGPEGHAYRAS